MQITVMNEGLLLNSKYIKTDREEAGFSSFPQTATPCNCSYGLVALDFRR